MYREWVPLAQFHHPDREANEFIIARFMISRADLADGRFDRVVSCPEFTE